MQPCSTHHFNVQSFSNRQAASTGVGHSTVWHCIRHGAVRGGSALCSRRRCAAYASFTQTSSSSRTTKLLKRRASAEDAQEALLQSIRTVKGRGKGGLAEEDQESFDQALSILVADGGVRAPTSSGLLDGRWKLLFTTRPGTASPIQRTFVGVNAFSVYQDISLEPAKPPRINNVVDFGQRIGQLVVEAEANTDSRPLPGFTPRQGQGLAVFGKSDNYPPAREDLRIDFQFDKGLFDFKFLPFKIPYPVPFKRLGDETKGWIDVTYLSPDGTFRLSKGNKGTTFVLAKDVPARARLLSALEARASDAQIERLAEEVVASGGGENSPADSDNLSGYWMLRWAAQAQDANPLQKALIGRVRATQTIQNGELRNFADLLPGVSVRTLGVCETASRQRTSVDLKNVWLQLGGLRIPLPVKQTEPGFTDWLYLDKDLRISRGNKGSYFIHTRLPA